MVRVRAGESFNAAVARDRRLFAAGVAAKEGATAGGGASPGVPVPIPNGSSKKGSGDGGEPAVRPTLRLRQPRRRGRRRNDLVVPQESPSSGGSDGPSSPGMRTEGDGGVPQESTSSGGSDGPPTPEPVRTEGAGVPKKRKVSGSSCGPPMPPPGFRMPGASGTVKSMGSGSCRPPMPPSGFRAEGASIRRKSKVCGSCGPGMPPLWFRMEGTSVPQKSKGSGSGSGSCGPAMPPSRVRRKGAGVLELAVEDTDALDCGVCFVPLKPPIFQCSNSHVACSLCHDKLKASGKCHVCGVTADGNSRCHAMERLAESIRFLCPNAAYGYTARLLYHDREGHCQKCPHSPFCCPDKACGFIGPMELLLDHFAYVHGWPSITTALASSFNVSLHDGFNFLHAVDHTSSSLGILFLQNVVRSPLGRAISMLCIGTCAAKNGQGQFSKEPIECEQTYSHYVSSKSRSTGDQLTDHYQRCKFRVALTNLSNGLPSTDDCFQFVVSNFALGENKETSQRPNFHQLDQSVLVSLVNL